MPSLKVHCAISKKRTRYHFRDLHKWIDKPHEELGVDHRLLRHAYTREDRDFIKNYWEKRKGTGWGDKAVVEWLFHIALDNIDTAFKVSQDCYGNSTYNYLEFGLASTGFFHVNFERCDDNELDLFFEEDDDDFGDF